MIDASLRDRILKQVDELPPELQQRVLDFASGLIPPRHRALPGADLVKRFSGIMDRDEADQMAAAIEEACERISPDEW